MHRTDRCKTKHNISGAGRARWDETPFSFSCFFFCLLFFSHPERVVVRLGDLPEPLLLRVHPVAVNSVVFVVPVDVSLCLLAVGALVCKGSNAKKREQQQRGEGGQPGRRSLFVLTP